MPFGDQNLFRFRSGNHNPSPATRIKNGKTGPGKKPPGRKKGVPNKLTQSLKAAFEASFNDPKVGGVKWLIKLAKNHPVAYASLFARMLPLDLNLKPPGPDRFEASEIARRIAFALTLASIPRPEPKVIEHQETPTDAP